MLPLLLLLHPFNASFSRTTWENRYQKGTTSLDLNEAVYDGFWDSVASAGPVSEHQGHRCNILVQCLMRAVATDVVASSVLVTLVTTVRPSKTAEPIEMAVGKGRLTWIRGTVYIMHGACSPQKDLAL